MVHPTMETPLPIKFYRPVAFGTKASPQAVRISLIISVGLCPKYRLNSRLNWEALSYPTLSAAM